MRTLPARPTRDRQQLLDAIIVRRLEEDELPGCQQWIAEHHDLGALRAVGERLHYVVADADGDWLRGLVFTRRSAAIAPARRVGRLE